MICLAALAARSVNLRAVFLILRNYPIQSMTRPAGKHILSHNNTNYPISIPTTLVQTLYLCLCQSYEDTTNQPEPNSNNCNIFKYVGVNDLSVNDIVVKSVTGNMACIKARFSLAIKVEATPESTPAPDITSPPINHVDNGSQPMENGIAEEDDKRLLLGYLPLDSVVSVEDSCPDANPDSVPKEGHQAEKGKRLILSEPRELEMIVHFECGKLSFSLRREDSFYVSAIKGVVNLDANTIREFEAEGPMFFTSDLNHHFKFNDLIEVKSSAKTKAFILTANFYNLEFETFRNTSSRGFIRLPDDNSKPFS